MIFLLIKSTLSDKVFSGQRMLPVFIWRHRDCFRMFFRFGEENEAVENWFCAGRLVLMVHFPKLAARARFNGTGRLVPCKTFHTLDTSPLTFTRLKFKSNLLNIFSDWNMEAGMMWHNVISQIERHSATYWWILKREYSQVLKRFFHISCTITRKNFPKKKICEKSFWFWPDCKRRADQVLFEANGL